MKQLPLGVALYTLRDRTAQDFIGTLKQVKEIGYQGVEFAGYGSISAKDMSAALKDIGLEAVSSHVPLDTLENNLPAALDYASEIGCSYIACPWIPVDRRGTKRGYVELAESLNRIGEQSRKQGISLLYHHHEFEFEQFDGEFALDIILNETDPDLVQLETDVFWAEFAGVSAADYIEKYAGRCPVIHLKDMTEGPERTFAEVGQGVISFEPILESALQSNVKWTLVEQDRSKRDPLESVTMSFNYLKSLNK